MLVKSHVRADSEIYYMPTLLKIVTKIHVRADPEIYYLPTVPKILTEVAVKMHVRTYSEESSEDIHVRTYSANYWPQSVLEKIHVRTRLKVHGLQFINCSFESTT